MTTTEKLKAETERLAAQLAEELKKYVYPVRIVKMPETKVVKK